MLTMSIIVDRDKNLLKIQNLIFGFEWDDFQRLLQVLHIQMLISI